MGSSFFSKDNCSNNKANLTFTIRVISTTFIRKNHDNNKNEIRKIDANVNTEFSILPPPDLMKHTSIDFVRMNYFRKYQLTKCACVRIDKRFTSPVSKTVNQGS